jgi:hypothetical protein
MHPDCRTGSDGVRDHGCEVDTRPVVGLVIAGMLTFSAGVGSNVGSPLPRHYANALPAAGLGRFLRVGGTEATD